jgi:transposase InsO family protein
VLDVLTSRRAWTLPRLSRGRPPSFTGRLDDRDIDHHLTPPASPDHNAVVERFQGAVLEEFYRPAFHRQFFTKLALLDDQLQDWVARYNTRRRNHGDYMRGRTSQQVLETRLNQMDQAA